MRTGARPSTMISETTPPRPSGRAGSPRRAFVWTWPKGRVRPVVVGAVTSEADRYRFNYARSWLARADASPLHVPELPLVAGGIEPLPGLGMAGMLRDASPDAWGRRVIAASTTASGNDGARGGEPDELDCLLLSGSDRIGALDFQASPDAYVPRGEGNASLADLGRAAELVDRGERLPDALELALRHGTSIGGARPKALLDADGRKLVAKFGSSTDLRSVVKAELVGMRLAKAVGLDVANVELASSLDKEVLIVERFDRVATDDGWMRRHLVSALTLLELDEMMARYASYERLADIVRTRFENPLRALRELYGRLVFNVLIGNTDDHARNHAAFVDGERLALAPAYDLCPQPRTGNVASQAMRIVDERADSTLATCVASAAAYRLSTSDAVDVVRAQVRALLEAWPGVSAAASLDDITRRGLWRRAVLNPYAFEGDAQWLVELRALIEHAGQN